MKKLIVILATTAFAFMLMGCPAFKPLARTALEAARHACSAYAEQTGLTFEDVCKTEKQLQPFIDSILAGQQAAAAAGATGACPECPDCEKAPEGAPEAKPAPEPPAAPATATPAAPAPAAPVPEKK